LQLRASKNLAFDPVGSRLQEYEPSARQALTSWECSAGKMLHQQSRQTRMP